MIYMACGYSGTGSSALVHLLSEYSNCTIGKLKKYEHILFYTPNGLFDLEDRLLQNNSIHGADGAISEFRKAMKRLNDSDFGWFGSLKKLFGAKFMQMVDEFIDELIDYRVPGYWSYDIKMVKSPIMFAKHTICKMLGREVSHYGYKVRQTGDGYILYSFISAERFYAAAKKFVAQYIKMVSGDSEKCFVCDQIFQPHHLNRMKNYFNEGEAKAIVVDRDARDMFVLGKYVWPSMGMQTGFPKEPDTFAKFYDSLVKSADTNNFTDTLCLHFEDLIYRYDETIETIEKFIGEKAGSHTDRRKCFVPEKSIKNTQNYRIRPEWIEETQIIAEMIPDLIYQFPYELNPLLNETTDP